LVLKETDTVEMKEEDQSAKGKTEKEKANAKDRRLKALEKLLITMKRHSDENEWEKVQ